MCSDGARVSKALRAIHAVKYLGADPRPMVDKLFSYHNSLMLTHRKIVSASKSNIEGVYIAVDLCEFCVVPWPCSELDKWLDTLSA